MSSRVVRFQNNSKLDVERIDDTCEQKKAGTAKRGCLLCMTGSFGTYEQYTTHMDSEDHKQVSVEMI